jgi:hypothetical protein
MLGCSAAGDLVKQTMEVSQSMAAKHQQSQAEHKTKVSAGLQALLQLTRERALGLIVNNPNSFYSKNRAGYKIALPSELNSYKTVLEYKGFNSEKVKQLEEEMNKAAQKSVQDLNLLVQNRIENLVFSDPQGIATGGANKVNYLAGSYLSKVTHDELLVELKGVIEKNLTSSNFKKLEAELSTLYSQLEIPSRPELDLQGETTRITLNVFLDEMFGQEMKIRAHPEATNSSIVYALTPPAAPILSLDYD